MTIILKSLRKQKKLTQRNIAEIFHISQTSVSKYEREEAVPDLELIVKMADFFGVSLDEFVNRKKQYQKEPFGRTAPFAIRLFHHSFHRSFLLINE